MFAFVNLASALRPNPGYRPGNQSGYQHGDVQVIERDVAVIGGGSSGTYSAIRLQQQGHSVALIEKENRLGGHVNTYVDPATGGTLDYGVVIFVNTSIVRSYFEYLNTPLGRFTGFVDNETTLYADFAAGTAVPAPNDTITASTSVVAYGQLLQDQYPYLAIGFNLPNPVPEELLIPYGDFLAERNLSAVAYNAWYIDEGVGDPLSQPALYMLKYYNLLQVQGLSLGFVNANNDFQGLCKSRINPIHGNELLTECRRLCSQQARRWHKRLLEQLRE